MSNHQSLKNDSLMNLRYLQTFSVVAVTRSFTAAASQLGYRQSSVTTQIKVLERQVGALLINRKRFSKDVILTDAGQRTLTYAKKILALAHKTVITAASEGRHGQGTTAR